MDHPIRVILDTNLWISYLISSSLIVLDQLIEDEDLVLLFSQESLEELIEVARRPKFERFFRKEDVEELLYLIDVYGEIVEVSSEVTICRDPKDNFLLALAKDGKANYLLTGDKDLLEVDTFEGAKILTYKQFEEIKM